MRALLLRLLLLPLPLPQAVAQRGDQRGERQPPLPAALALRPPPPRTPDAEQATFTLAPEFEIRLVASEPLVEAPVALAFAPDGRLFVVEMRGYMRDVDGGGEREPSGRIVTLHDDDGDGRMDRREVFLDRLVLPRGVLPLACGALVIEPPKLWFCPDADRDGRADAKVEVAGGFDDGLTNPEHCGNAPTWCVDNWIRLARHPFEFRRDGAGFVARATFGGGQWGLAQDDAGRLFYNYNSDALRADLLPPHYFARDPALPGAAINLRVLDDQRVWPSHPTPGVNRGYRDGQLRDGRLATFTAACGVAVVRGGLLPGCDGNAFVCEPSGNLLRRLELTAGDDRPRARNPHPGAEFLTSTDERFRPVHVLAGPDGALWVTDMYRGVIQHRNFVTTWLREQIVARRLEQPIDRGRIWRITGAGRTAAPLPDLTRLDARALAAELRHPIGPRRDLAQQWIVERGERDAAEPLWAIVRTPTLPAAVRAQALWTLDGLAQVTRERLAALVQDPDPELRSAAWRIGERVMRELWPHPIGTAPDEPDAWVRRQYLLSAGTQAGRDALRQLAAALWRDRDDPRARAAALAGLHGRELAFVDLLFGPGGWPSADAGTRATLHALAGAITRRRDAAAIDGLLARAAVPGRAALLEGMLATLPAGAARAGSLRLARAPCGLPALIAAGDPELRGLAAELLGACDWPGRDGFGLRPLAPEEAARFAAGRAAYALRCAVCHQPDGSGRAGLAPPLAAAPRLRGSPESLVRIVLHGLRGPVTIAGETWELHMPGQPQLDDGELAAILTFARLEFAGAAPVAPELVARVRAADAARADAWTAAELDGGR